MIENKYDWKIHKILDETKRVYICPARGNSKLYNQLELYVDLFTQKKDIHVIRIEDLKKAATFKDVFIDKDLHPNSISPWMRDALDRYFEEEMHKQLRKDIENWRPKVYLDTSLINPRDWYTKQLTVMDSLLGSFIVASEENECVTE